MSEWFQSSDEMLKFYQVNNNYEKLVNNFVKLNQLYIAIIYHKPEIVRNLQDTITEVVSAELKAKKMYDETIMKFVVDFSNKLVCKDFLQKEFCLRSKYPGKLCSVVFNNAALLKKETVEAEFSFPSEFVTFCEFHLKPNGKKDFSLPNLTRFLEIGGMNMLTNQVQVVNV